MLGNNSGEGRQFIETLSFSKSWYVFEDKGLRLVSVKVLVTLFDRKSFGLVQLSFHGETCFLLDDAFLVDQALFF